MERISLATFVVGVPPREALRLEPVMVDGSPNVLIVAPEGGIPPLNRTGLRRLAKTLEAVADLIEHAQACRLDPEWRA